MLQSTNLTPIYGRCGTVIAWIDDDVIFDQCGRWTAFLDETDVYHPSGKLLGFYEDGWFRDCKGDGVAFTEGCSDNGPVPPICDPVPLPPSLTFPPLPPAATTMPVSPLPTVDWSLLTWNEFIAGSGTLSSVF